jgi:hypothetical protein
VEKTDAEIRAPIFAPRFLPHADAGAKTRSLSYIVVRHVHSGNGLEFSARSWTSFPPLIARRAGIGLWFIWMLEKTDTEVSCTEFYPPRGKN